VNKFYIQLLVWAFVIGGAFAFLWKQGYLVRLSAYVGETREELKKCSWPSRAELWQSTVLIAVVMFSLGLFTIVVDFIVLKFVRFLL
jgi:preprotein translocase subunit SecE